MSELMDSITAEDVLLVEKPLDKAKDEEAAELLATIGTATGVERASGGKISTRYVYQLVNAYASVSQKRAALFRGRVKFKIIEMQEELRTRRLSLASKAVNTYDSLMGTAIRKKRPEVAAMVAKDTLHGVGFFEGEGVKIEESIVSFLAGQIVNVINEEVKDPQLRVKISRRVADLTSKKE